MIPKDPEERAKRKANEEALLLWHRAQVHSGDCLCPECRYRAWLEMWAELGHHAKVDMLQHMTMRAVNKLMDLAESTLRRQQIMLDNLAVDVEKLKRKVAN